MISGQRVEVGYVEAAGGELEGPHPLLESVLLFKEQDDHALVVARREDAEVQLDGIQVIIGTGTFPLNAELLQLRVLRYRGQGAHPNTHILA